MASKKKAPKKKIPKKAIEKKTLKPHSTALAVQAEFTGLHVDMPVKVTPVELMLPDGLEREEWEETIFKVGQVSGASNWWLGDAILYGEQHYGELYAQGIADAGVSPERAKAALYVSNRVAPVRRINNPIVTWSHHKEVASCTDKEQTSWLERAFKNDWSVRDLKEAMRKKGHKSASEKEPTEEDESICACCTNKAKIKICSKCFKRLEAIEAGALHQAKREASGSA